MDRRSVVLIAAHQHVSPENESITHPSATEAAERRVRSLIKPLFGENAIVQTQIIISPNTKEGTDSTLLAQLVELLTCDRPPATFNSTKLKPVEKRAYGLPLTESEEESTRHGNYTCFTVREKMLDIVLVSHDVHLLNAAVTIFNDKKMYSKRLHLVLYATGPLYKQAAVRVESMVREVEPNTNIFFRSFGKYAHEYIPEALYRTAYPRTPPSFMIDALDADRREQTKTGPYSDEEIVELYVRSRTDNTRFTVLTSFEELAHSKPIVVLWDNDAAIPTPNYGGVPKDTLRAYGRKFEAEHNIAKGSATIALLQRHPSELGTPLTIPTLFDACV
jgi:hypothetical protein